MRIAPSTVELKRMRSDAEALMTGTCSIVTISRQPDGQGGWTETESTTTGVPCRLGTTGYLPRTDIMGDQWKMYEVFVLSVHWDRTIAPGDKAIYDNRTYEVLAVELDQTLRVTRRCFVHLVTPLES